MTDNNKNPGNDVAENAVNDNDKEENFSKLALIAGAILAPAVFLTACFDDAKAEKAQKSATADDIDPAAAFAVLVDTRRCVNCKACQISCKVWNDNTPDPTTFKTTFTKDTWLYIQENEFGGLPVDTTDFTTGLRYVTTKRQCMHCEDPACVQYCPVAGQAIHKEKDGPVLVNHENCIRCKACVATCPYGVPRFDAENNQIVKCTFCFDKQRSADGEVPACVDTCVAGALQAGTLAEIRTLAQGYADEGAQVFGLDDGYKTSWVYVFAADVDPYEIFKLQRR